MSDLSHPYCRRCRNPDYACDCDEPIWAEPAINFVLRREEIPPDHPFCLHRESMNGGLDSFGANDDDAA